MADSTIPGAINALVALATTAMAPFQTATETVAIYDSDVDTDVPPDYIGIAFPDADDPADNPGVSGEQSFTEIGDDSRSETFEIRCEIATWSGGDTLTARRARAFAMFKAFQDALRADPGLSGAISTSGFAYVGPFTLATGGSPQGPLARINFTVLGRNIDI